MPEEQPVERVDMDDVEEPVPPVERRSPAAVPEPGLRSAAERAAARRRLDSLAEEF